MNDFDRKMRDRAAQEEMQVNAAAEARMADRLYSAPEPKKKKEREINILAVPAVLCGVAAALILLLAFFLQPQTDSTLGVLPSETHLPQMVPVTQGKLDEKPVVSSDIVFEGDTVRMTTWLENPVDDDIWLIAWQPLLEGAVQQPVSQLIWLEPGAMCSQTYEWNGVEAQSATVRWQYTAYRVTAHTLHWMEDEALLQDAFDAGALILQPGDWPNGQAGEMNLLLPKGQTQDPLSYYIENGMLSAEDSADEMLTVVKEP